MIVYPAIDLLGGSCVRLRQGVFEDATVYSLRPDEAIDGFEAAGAEWVHIVDLDGARAGVASQHELFATLVRRSGLKLQVAGGIRSEDDLQRLFDAGVSRAVIGSLAVAAPERVQEMLDRFGPDRIALALDVRIEEGRPLVATSGWQEISSASLWDVGGQFPGARHMLITDIGRDGMLEGPNVDLIAEAVRRFPRVQVQASGGVSSARDLDSLRRRGAAGAIVGKALWEGILTLEEALGDACP